MLACVYSFIPLTALIARKAPTASRHLDDPPLISSGNNRDVSNPLVSHMSSCPRCPARNAVKEFRRDPSEYPADIDCSVNDLKNGTCSRSASRCEADAASLCFGTTATKCRECSMTRSAETARKARTSAMPPRIRQFRSQYLDIRTAWLAGRPEDNRRQA